MRALLGITLALSIVLGGRAVASTKCGDDGADPAAVTAAETAIATQCDCCAPRGEYRACVAAVVKAATRATTLRSRCASKVRRDVAHACPLVPSTTACRVCNADSDCAVSEFCECRAGTCAKTGGVCLSRPQVCPDVVAPVCGCDGTTYGNDCLRRQAGACKLHNGPCVATGGCFDTITGACTGQACSPAAGCLLPNEFCSPACGSPPPTGTCFDTLARKCTTESCGPDQPCLPNEFCVTTCPPPPPTGRCFVTVDGQCSTEPCGPGVPCQNPNEFCAPQCLPPTCGTNADCDDGNPCTADQCINGTCEHACVCVAPTGVLACCPGPGTTCAQPCGSSADGTCGGTCPVGDQCSPSATGCACAPAVRLCGDTFPTCDGTCPVGTSCQSLTGALACQCVPQGCAGGTGAFFYTCGAPVCGGPPLQSGVPACTTEQVGAPCPCLGATCDPGDVCHRLLECATADPTHGGICPISRRAYKTNIEYLSAEDLTRLHDALLKFRLASYQYAIPGASPASHLGFVIDDVTPSPSVAEGGDTVELYGYASMAVAAVQTQAREIAALQREVESLRAVIKSRGSGGCAVTATAPPRSKRAHTSSGTSEPGHPG